MKPVKETENGKIDDNNLKERSAIDLIFLQLSNC